MPPGLPAACLAFAFLAVTAARAPCYAAAPRLRLPACARIVARLACDVLAMLCVK